MSRNFTSTTPNGSQNTQTDVWITPKWLIDKIGINDLDPCGFKPSFGSHIVETAHKYYYEEDNGLIQEWYDNVFVNFPYSDAKNWMRKCSVEFAKGNCEIIVLCFARTETQWFQDNVKNAIGINFIRRRIQFLDSSGQVKSNANAPSCLIAYGENSYRRIKCVDGVLVKIDKS